MKPMQVIVAIAGVAVMVGGILQINAGLHEAGVARSHGAMQIIRAETSRGYADLQAIDPTTTFAPTDLTIHLVVAIRDCVAGTTLTATWWAVDAGGSKDEKFHEDSGALTEGDKTMNLTVVAPQPWPVGSYRADVALNGKVEKSVAYTVAAGR